MNIASLLIDNFSQIIAPFGGRDGLTASAKAEGAVIRWRKIKDGETWLRFVLSYCFGDFSLRGVCAWACSVELADIANTSFLERLFKCENWLKALIAQALAYSTPPVARKRLIRLVDGTSVRQAGADAKKSSRLWRLNCVFDLPSERFSFFELTDEKTGEQLDMAPVILGEIRIGDRCYLQPERMAKIIDAGGDLVIRAVWTNARWRDEHGKPVNLTDLMRKHAGREQFDVPIWIACKSGRILAVRLVATKKSEEHILAARSEIIAQARKRNKTASEDALEAAAWILLVTTLAKEEFSANDILDLYRLRWRIELAFKRLKSLIGLKAPPGKDERSAKVWILAHLLMAILAEPLVSELDLPPSPEESRLTTPGLWRITKQVVASLRQAIMPQSTIDALRAQADALKRHFHEPPRRKRRYQQMPCVP